MTDFRCKVLRFVYEIVMTAYNVQWNSNLLMFFSSKYEIFLFTLFFNILKESMVKFHFFSFHTVIIICKAKVP